jgi:ankyrin repeat protein
MPIHPLPANPSLENLRKRAKGLHKSLRAGEAQALDTVREFHPRADQAIPNFTLADAQLVVARGHGFPTWAKLKQHLLEVIEPLSWDPREAPGADDPRPLSMQFVELACLNYGGWHLRYAERARQMLESHPEVAGADIYTAATVGDSETVKAGIAADPAAANRKGGALEWPPLLYACYSRLNSSDPAHSTLEVARLLLAAGADANAGFLWRGLVPPFTALTGAFGGGEAGVNNPPHAEWRALARLLLEAGADPNDGQTLYNRHFNADNEYLELLFAFGLGQAETGPWYRRLGSRLMPIAITLAGELWSAAKYNFAERVKLLIEHGVDPNQPGWRDGRTPYQTAVRHGNQAVADYLLQHGAGKINPSPEEAFALDCLAGRHAEAMARLAQDPALPQRLGLHGRIELVHRAVEGNHPEGVRMLARLGFELSAMIPGTGHDRTAMHNAAWRGDLEMVKLLVELGADRSIRELNHNATPLGWALYNRQPRVVEYLARIGTIFDAVLGDSLERVADLLQQDSACARAVDPLGHPLAFYLQPGTKHLTAIVRLLEEHGFDLNARSTTGKTALDVALAEGNDSFAETLRRLGAKTAGETTS